MQQAQQEPTPEQRVSREAALSEVLSSYIERRAVSYRFVAVFVVLGLVGSVTLAWTASMATARPSLRFEAAGSELMRRGVAAFDRGDWDEAERILREAAEAAPRVPVRLSDYAERLALIRRDGERLARAEEALEADSPARALAQVALIGANSPLFAQAEVLSRAARAQAEAELLAEQAAQLEAEAERQASRAAVARALPPAPAAPPPRSVRPHRNGAPARRPSTQAPSSTNDAW
jgi:hypothetical protein